MSLSRIIKSVQQDSASVGEYTFRPIAQAIVSRPAEELSAGFVPLGIFDPSEISANRGAEQEIAEVPTVTLTEEELSLRLNQSFEQGLQEGKNLAERGLLNVFRSLRAATEGIHALREKVMRESEDELIDLTMLVARKVILREVAQDRSILSNVVRSAVSTLSDKDEMTIRLNPEDYEQITSGHDESFRKELQSERVRFKPDPTVTQGGCQIDTEMGTLDACIDAQLDEIYRRLLEERSESVGAAL